MPHCSQFNIIYALFIKTFFIVRDIKNQYGLIYFEKTLKNKFDTHYFTADKGSEKHMNINDISCKKDHSLTKDEKEIFTPYLVDEGLSDNIWDIFNEWVEKSTPEIDFFYLKVYRESELIGLGLFLKVKPFDLRSSYSRLRNNPYLKKIAGSLSKLMGNCVYISFRNLITANITRPFFYKESGMEDVVMQAILSSLKKEKEADMVSIIDTTAIDQIYEQEGFIKYPSSSEAYFDATKYKDIAEYLGKHRSLRKNIAKKKKKVKTDVQKGPVSDSDRDQMKACVECSVVTSKVNNPCQDFFENNIFKTEVFNSNKYVHIIVRVENIIAGFHTYQISGSHMGGVLGGFNREYSKNNYIYERVIVASLDYAIKNNIKRVHYSLIDNYTKLRLVESRESCGLYFFSRNPINKSFFSLTYKFNDIYDLFLLESTSGK